MRYRYQIGTFKGGGEDDAILTDFLNEWGEKGYRLRSMTLEKTGWWIVVVERTYEDPGPALRLPGETTGEAVQRVITDIRNAGSDVRFRNNILHFQGADKATQAQMDYLELHRDEVKAFLDSEEEEN